MPAGLSAFSPSSLLLDVAQVKVMIKTLPSLWLSTLCILLFLACISSILLKRQGGHASKQAKRMAAQRDAKGHPIRE